MPKFLVSATYTAEGLEGLRKDKASGRRRAIKKAITALGGKLESMYYCFGADDAVLVVDLPNNASAAAVSVSASASGAVRVRVTPLLTVDEADEALAMSTEYRAPGAES